MIIIKNKRCKLENIRKEYPGAIIFDVTSKGALKTLSPFYPQVVFQYLVLTKNLKMGIHIWVQLSRDHLNTILLL